MKTKGAHPDPALSPPIDSAPPSYDDSLQTPWQGASHGQSSGTSPSIRPALDPAQYSLYSTNVPDYAEQLTYAERLVAGVETTTVTSHNHVVTHSPLLHDPEALEAFIKQQASIPPTLKLSCRGHHLHQRYSQEMLRSDSDLSNRNRSHNEIVVDFDFEIDLTSILESTVDLRTLTTPRPDRAVPRGTFHSTFHPDFKPYGPYYRDHSFFDLFSKQDSPTQTLTEDTKSRSTRPGTRLVRQEKKLWVKYLSERFAKGLPSWAVLPQEVEAEIQKVRDQVARRSESKHRRNIRRQAIRLDDGTADYARLDQVEDGHSPPEEGHLDQATLLEWCQEFCRSRRPLKEFRLPKSVYGWEFSPLLVAIKAAIASTGYQGNVDVRLVPTRTLVTVHPDNYWSRWLTKTWVTVLLWLTLLYPFVWLYKRLFAGGTWTVCTAHYPLKCYVPYDPTRGAYSGVTSVAGNSEIRLGPSSSSNTEGTQLFELRGYKEGRFMKRWESKIKNAVRQRVGSNGRPESLGDALLVEREDADGRQANRALDGYESA